MVWNPMALIAKSRLSVDEEIIMKSGNMIAYAGLSFTRPRLLTTSEMLKYYGNPGDSENLVIIDVPYPLRIAWDVKVTVNKVTVHKKVAPHLLSALKDLHKEYGYNKIVALDLDLFGGLGNFRPQRGLENKYAAAMKAKNYSLAYTYLSRHAWFTAIDFSPAKNALKMKKPKAQFSKPEYDLFWQIMYRNKFIGYGKERGNDYMHFEIGVTQ